MDISKVGLAFFVYRRPEHTKKVLDSLKLNQFEKIYIFQDGLKRKEDYNEWMEVNEIINNIDFIDKEIYIAKKNQGLAASIIGGFNYLFDKYEGVIALEDDIVLGSNYTEYMLKCFTKYKNNPEIMGIAGGGWPSQIAKENYSSKYAYDIYFSYRMSSMAFGTWKDRWLKYSKNMNDLPSILKEEKKRKIFDSIGSDIPEIIKGQIMGVVDSWTIYWQIMQIKNNGVCVIPIKDLAIDIGHDGINGTNSTSQSNRYQNKLYNYDFHWEYPDTVFMDENIMEENSLILGSSNSLKIAKFNQNILQKWLQYKQENRSIQSYFCENKIEDIYIYGAGLLAKLLIKEISSYVTIKGIIVQCKKEQNFLGYNVFDFNDDISLECENIIITPAHDIRYITYAMKKRFLSNTLIDIDEIFTIGRK